MLAGGPAALAQHERPASAAAMPALPRRPAELRAGQQLFQRECAGCHGPAGEGGRGPTLALPRLARATDDAALVQVIDRGVPGSEMPGSRLTDAEVRAVAAWVRRLGQRPAEPAPGDPRRGQTLYAGKGGCPVCHAIAGVGGATGPDLSDIGLRRGASFLRAAIVDPEAALPKSTSPYRADISLSTNFLQVRAVTSAGQELTGVRVNEDTFSIQIRDMTNRVHSLWKAELRQLDKLWGRSPMPSYREALSGAELDDLVSYLMSLRGTDPRQGVRR